MHDAGSSRGLLRTNNNPDSLGARKTTTTSPSRGRLQRFRAAIMSILNQLTDSTPKRWSKEETDHIVLEKQNHVARSR